jgi:hypothetical protein
VEDPCPVHAAFGHQEMEVRVEVDPIPEGLDGGNDTGDSSGQRPPGRPAGNARTPSRNVARMRFFAGLKVLVAGPSADGNAQEIFK